MPIRYGTVDWRDMQNLDRYQSVRYKPRIWEPLKASVTLHGFINPCIAWATKGDIRIIYGLSRAAMARELDLPLPAVICDYDRRFPQYERLHGVDEIAAKWQDPDTIRPFIHLSDTKLWMTHHPRVPINANGDSF